MRPRWSHPMWCPGAATMRQLPGRAQHAVKTRFRSDILPGVGQRRYDLGRSLTGMLRTVADLEDIVAFVFVQGIARHRLQRQRAPIAVRRPLPPPIRARTDLEHGTGGSQTRACGDGRGDQRHGTAAVVKTDHSSSSSPQRASTFFSNTSSAAASASAFSLRWSSRLSSCVRLRTARMASLLCLAWSTSQLLACSQA